MEDDGEAEEGDTPQRMLSESAYAASARGYNQLANLPPSHEFVFRRDRSVRGATIPPTGRNTAPQPLPSANIEGATDRLNAQIYAASMSTGSSRRPSGQGHGHRSMADMLPIIEASNSPPPSDVASNLSAGTNHSNGAGFFRTYQDGAPLTVSPRGNGALTPDLNYAEIGHGRGANDAPVARSTRGNVFQPRPPIVETDHSPSSPPGLNPTRAMTSANHRDARTQAHGPSIVWPYQEPSDMVTSSSSNQVLGDAHGSTQHASGTDDRGRSAKRSFRNTLNVAEQYASSLLFGRSSSRVAGGSGTSPVRGNGSGAAPRGR